MDELKVTEKIEATENIKEVTEVVEATKQEAVKQEESIEVTVTPDVAFNLRLQEFDKGIALTEQKVSELKAQKASFIYDSSLQIITEQHKADLIRKQIEEETLKRTKK